MERLFGMAPPTKYTPEVVSQVLAALRGGADMSLAAKAAGVSRRVLFDWQAKHSEFAEQLEEAKAVADDIVEKRLFDMTSDNVTACIFWLKNRRRKSWRDRYDETTANAPSSIKLKAGQVLDDGGEP